MLKRLELTGYSMINRMAQLDVVSNNVANVNTTGYKRDDVFVQAVNRQLDRLTRAGQTAPARFPYALQRLDFSQGSLAETNEPLDVALSGDGFFVVETPEGEAYTRSGRFTLSPDNVLTTVNGETVMGQGGAIQIQIDQDSPNEILINNQGEIFLDNNLIDQLQIVRAENPDALVKTGANLFRLNDPRSVMLPVEDPAVRQGFLEDANVNAVAEMINMMEIVRHFELDQKVVKTQDELLNRAANQIGRVG